MRPPSGLLCRIGRKYNNEAQPVSGHKKRRGCSSGDTEALGQSEDGQIDRQVGTGHHSSVDGLGQGDCGLEHAKNKTRLHTGFPSCSLAGLRTSPSHQDTSRGPNEVKMRKRTRTGTSSQMLGSAFVGPRLVYREVLAWFGEQLNIPRAQ